MLIFLLSNSGHNTLADFATWRVLPPFVGFVAYEFLNLVVEMDQRGFSLFPGDDFTWRYHPPLLVKLLFHYLYDSFVCVGTHIWLT